MVITEKKIKDFINCFLTSLFNVDKEIYYKFHTNFLSIVKDKKFYWTYKLSYNYIQKIISYKYKNIYELLFNLTVFALEDTEFMVKEFGVHEPQFDLINRVFRFQRIEREYQLNISLINEIFIKSFQKIIGDLTDGYTLKIKNKKNIFYIEIKKINI